MEAEVEAKRTEVTGLPKGWVWRGLNEVADNLDNKRKPINATEREGRRGDVPYYGATGQVGWIDTHLLNEELVLVGEDGAPFLEFGRPKAYMISGKSWVNNHAHVLRAKDGMPNAYLMHFLNILDYSPLVTGTTRLKLTKGAMSKILVPVAPLPEQRRIVGAIERHLGRLDAAVARLHAAKAKLKRYKQAVLNEVFDVNWETARLDEVCLKIQDGSHFSPKEQYGESAIGRYKYITSKNIRNGYMNLDDMVYVTKEYFDTIYPRCKPELNDVLLTKDGANTGNVTLNTLDEPYALLSSVCLLKPDRSKLIPEFLMYFIQSPEGFKQLTGKMTGTAIKRIILQRIREAPIPMPSITVQRQLVDFVATRLESADETDSTLDSQLLKATRLRQAVLKRAFEGRLV